MAAVIWVNGTPMALAFSRSMVTRSCGSLAVKVVFMAVRPEPGALPCADHGVGDAVDVAEGVAAAVLQDELEAADGADASDGGGLGGEGDAAGDAEELGADVGDDVLGGELVAHLGAVVDGLERGEDEAGVGRAAAGEREAHDGEGAEDAVVLADHGGDAVGELGGVAERGAGRRLDDDEEVGLVFLRDEGRGDVVVHERGGGESADEEQQAWRSGCGRRR